MQQFFEWLDGALQHYQALFVLVVLSTIYMLIRLVVLRRFEKLAASTKNDLDDRFIHFMKQFLGIVLAFAAIMFILKIYNISISPLLAGAGIMGVALGFAAKETIVDILAGVFLIVDRPVRIGDRVKIDKIGRHWGSWGDVVDIGLRRTQIRNTDGITINYPNALLANSVITNFSFDSSAVRARIRFQVDYSADLDLMQAVVIEPINSCEEVIPDTAQIVIRSLWDYEQGHMLSGVLVEARYRIEDVRNRTNTRSIVLQKILKTLNEHQIPIATPL
jgi:small-conductance mechanosensitive channel